MNKQLKIALKLFSSIIVAIVVLLAMLLVGVRLFGLQIYTVLSPSMEPDYPTGALIYVKEVDPSELKVGDVITFKLGSSTSATHRIIELVPDETNPDTVRFRTKGDANDVADGSLVDPGSVIGSPIFTIPYLGYVASYIQHPPGMYVAIAVSAVLVFLVFLFDSLTEDKDKKKKRKNAADASTQIEN